MKKSQIFTIDNELPAGPIIAFILLIFFVITDVIQWQWILILGLHSLGNSVSINWRILLSKPIETK